MGLFSKPSFSKQVRAALPGAAATVLAMTAATLAVEAVGAVVGLGVEAVKAESKKRRAAAKKAKKQ